MVSAAVAGMFPMVTPQPITITRQRTQSTS
jgi:hypothetical protein